MSDPSNHSPAVAAQRTLLEAAEALNAGFFRAWMYYAAHARRTQLVALTGPSWERFVRHAEYVDAVYSADTPENL